jgi:predicted dehydrogenase
MRVLVVGLGSMGKRRMRNLQAIGITEIAGFDPRKDRQAEAAEKYGVVVFDSYEEAIAQFSPTAIVVSTSPKHHMDYAWSAFDMGIHCFIEVSVVEADRILALHERARGEKIVIAPSCTMRYFPGPKMVKQLLDDGAIGTPLNVNYQTGQYLPDWHPWERVEDYYVSDPETGGCREIVPFEFAWLNDIFGDPKPLACAKAKLTDINADIDDVYHCLLRYSENILANVTIEVISRPLATRELRVLGSEGELVMSADENCVRHIRVGMDDWQTYSLSSGTVESGYIHAEEPYISELRDFVHAAEIGDPSYFPNSLHDDYCILQLVYSLEKLAERTQ